MNCIVTAQLNKNVISLVRSFLQNGQFLKIKVEPKKLI